MISYVRTRVRATREKLVDPVWFDNQGWEYIYIFNYYLSERCLHLAVLIVAGSCHPILNLLSRDF
jgi:hypothetical protein